MGAVPVPLNPRVGGKGMSKKIDFNPVHRAFTGGVGKPTKIRSNNGRIPIPQSLTPYPVRPTSAFEKLRPYATSPDKPVRVVQRAPEGLTPERRKRWHKLRKMGII